MVPLKLRLHNFMCYRQPAPLDFAGIHLACLAGDNGHGKSALLDAMTWALWGKARARAEDELVTMGEKEMQVEFEFQLGGQQYRVIRKRELGRQSKSALEFQIQDDGEFRPFTASTQRETQARINGVLRMDYDTFINSALLLQGRADEFTVKAPAERKRVLADILGLSVYTEYEQRAKELAKEKEQAEREVAARIQEIEREIDRRSEYEQELQTAQQELAQLSAQAKEAEAVLRELRDRLKALEAQQAQLVDANNRVQAAEARLGELDAQAEAQEERIAAFESVLARRQEILSGHTRLLQLRQQQAELSTKATQLLSLNEDRTRLEKRIADAQKDLELKKRSAEEKVAHLEKLTAERPALEADYVRVSAELEELAALQGQVEADKERIGVLTNEQTGLAAYNGQLRADMAALKDKLDLLAAPTAACPLCGQDLTEEDRQRLVTQFQTEGTEKGESYRSNEAQHKEIAVQIASLRSEVVARERELRRLPALQSRGGTLNKSIQDAREADVRLEEERRGLSHLQGQLEHREFAPEDQVTLAALERRIADLGYNKAAHDELRQAEAQLSAFDAERAALDKAEQGLAQSREHRQQLQGARDQRAAELEADRQRQSELSAALAGLEGLAQSVQEKDREVNDLRGRENRAIGTEAAAQQKLDHCAYLARERQDRVKQLKALAEERSLYDELQVAFGKKGLQALIIETAIPEIEGEASELLGRMTDGRMSLQFETQRDTKSGSTVETLDIKISDESGPRSYEMYSGGEAFRINFAVRIALSKLLARRAGAQLQTLIIDEGFGTQDADGRQKLVEAINSIKDDFARILVITHIEELKDAFPVRIDVFRTAQGSQIAIH